MNQVIKYLKGLQRRTDSRLTLLKKDMYGKTSYDFEIVWNGQSTYRYEGTLNDKTCLKTLKKSMAKAVPFRYRKKNT